MRRFRAIAISVLILAVLAACGGDNEMQPVTAPVAEQPSPTATAASTATPAETASATHTPTVTPSPTPTQTAVPEATTTLIPTDPVVYHDIIFNGLIGGEYDSNLRLYSVDADGSDLVPLTTAPDGIWEAYPVPSPDGTRVAFLRGFRSSVEGGVPPPAEVRVIDLLTGEETLIIMGVATDMSWSPDGLRLAFTWYEDGINPCCAGLFGLTARLVVVNADGGGSQVLSEEVRDHETNLGVVDLSPHWSPDGSRLLFLRSRTSTEDWSQTPVILDLDSLELTELDIGDIRVEHQIAWTPDGESIAFVGGNRSDTERPEDLYLMAADGSSLERLTEPGVRTRSFAISPDGTRIAVDGTSLGVLERATGDLTWYPVSPSLGVPAWSPDGTRIAVIAGGYSSPGVHIFDLDMGELSPVLAKVPTTELARGIPVWRPALTAPLVPDHGWSDDTLRTVVPGTEGAAFPNPLLDYPWVAWNAYAEDAGGRRIIARNLETGSEVEIARGGDVGWQFAIDDGVVVWLEGGTTLHATSLVTGNDLTTAVREAWVPRISGRWVVWTQPSADDRTELMAWDVWTAANPVAVTTSAGSFCSSYEVSGDRVAWVECFQNPFGARLTVRNILTGETVRTIEHDWAIYPLDLHGSTLVHVLPARDWFSGDPATIVVEDLETGETRQLQAHVNTHEGAYRITTDGRFIVFEGRPSGYDLEQGAWFDLPVDGHAVALEDGRLVWAIKRSSPSGLTEIHLAPAAEFSSGQRSRYFAETDSWLALGFLRFWEMNGGLPVFGYPFGNDGWTDAGWDNPLQLRWTERQRFEWHPENAGTVYEIQLGRLGAELLDQHGRDWRALATADPTSPHYFVVTGHAIAPVFWDYWSDHGLDLGDRGVSFRESVALFGYPLSEPMLETNTDGDTVLTQYFERAVFEYHPDNPAEWRVLLRRLGAEVLATTE